MRESSERENERCGEWDGEDEGRDVGMRAEKRKRVTDVNEGRGNIEDRNREREREEGREGMSGKGGREP